MEDSHITETRVKPPGSGGGGGEEAKGSDSSGAPHAKVFCVFDGHGGREVALFVEKHFVEELVKAKEYQGGEGDGEGEGGVKVDVGTALR